MRTGEKLAVRQSQRTPGRLSRRPGNTGNSSSSQSPSRRRTQPGPARYISIHVPSENAHPDSRRALLLGLVSVGPG